MKNIDFIKLINDHYFLLIEKDPQYSKKYTYYQMKKWWYKIRKIQGEEETEKIIKNVIKCVQQNILYHPV